MSSCVCPLLSLLAPPRMAPRPSSLHAPQCPRHLHAPLTLWSSLAEPQFISLGAQLSAVHQARCDADASRAAEACDAADRFHSWASKGLQWFLEAGMLNSSSLINDGLDTFGAHPDLCLNNRHSAYTYNQGVILSGLGYLYASKLPPPQLSLTATSVDAAARGMTHVHARRDVVAAVSGPAPTPAAADRDALLRIAASIVEAVWRSNLTHADSGGVLRDMNEPVLENGTLADLYTGNPGNDGLQFKSVLVRHLRYLINTVLRAHGGDETAAQRAVSAAGGNLTEWRARIAVNGRSIWAKAACAPSTPMQPGKAVEVPPLFGYLWRGPCAWAFGGASATTQTAALDVFTAAS